MIKLTRLNGVKFMVNVERIVTVESMPDTIITLDDGNKIIVRDSLEEIEKKTVEFRAQCLARGQVLYNNI